MTQSFKTLSFFAALGSLSLLSAVASAQPFWSQYGRNAQHTAMVTTGVQAMNKILWQTPLDLYPPVDGTDLFIHYGTPLITIHGTVVVNVRTGPNSTYPTSNDTFRVEGHAIGDGTTRWVETSDFTDWMPHDWTPSYGSALDNNGVLYYPGAGGTVWKRSSAETATAAVTREVFYGMSNYQSNTAGLNGNVQICTPITVDSFNNIYFGFFVTSGWSNSLGLASGIAKISPTGVGTWVTADNASGDSGDEVATNSAPAISNDGNYVYVAVKQQGESANPKLLRLRTSNLTTASEVALQPPPDTQGNATFAYILDDGTSSPMVGPDGDVYFGIWWSDLASRGFMLHYSSDLTQTKPAGAFGWDDTASVVPSYAVPSYSGTSKYLILTKYNNYADPGVDGDGLNRVAILDPNATEYYTVQYGPNHNPPNTTGPTYVCMNEVETVLGPTPNTPEDLPGVREWCINMAAIDVAGKAAIINSEDGHAYRWDLTTNELTQMVDLNQPIAEAYTPTLVSQDGISFAVNNATLYALWDGAAPSSVVPAQSSITAGNSSSVTITLNTAATGPGAAIYLASTNPHLVLPRAVTIKPGTDSVTVPFTTTGESSTENVTITAYRYDFTASGQVTMLGQALYSLFLSKNPIAPGTTANGSVTLTGPAPTTGRTVTLSSNLAAINFSSKTLKIANGYDSASFTYSVAAGTPAETGQVTATLDDGTKLSEPISIN